MSLYACGASSRPPPRGASPHAAGAFPSAVHVKWISSPCSGSSFFPHHALRRKGKPSDLSFYNIPCCGHRAGNHPKDILSCGRCAFPVDDHFTTFVYFFPGKVMMVLHPGQRLSSSWYRDLFHGSRDDRQHLYNLPARFIAIQYSIPSSSSRSSQARLFASPGRRLFCFAILV